MIIVGNVRLLDSLVSYCLQSLNKNKNMGNKSKFRWYVSFLLRQWIAWVNVRSVIINQQVRFRAKQRAKYSSLQLVSNCVKHCIKLTTQISTAINAPFSQNSNRMASRLTATASFQLLQFSRQRPSFSADRAKLWWQSWLDFSSIFYKICRFCSSILLSL